MEKVLLIEGLQELGGPKRTCKEYKKVKTVRGEELRCAKYLPVPGVPIAPFLKKPYRYFEPETGIVRPGGGRATYKVKLKTPPHMVRAEVVPTPPKEVKKEVKKIVKKPVSKKILKKVKKIVKKPALKKMAGYYNYIGGEIMEGRLRSCVEWQEVYSPVLGKTVRRCKRFAGILGEIGLEGKRVRRRRKRGLALEALPKGAKCVRYQEVYSPKLGKSVKRCAEWALSEGLTGLEDPARCVEWQEVYSPALGKVVRRCKRFAGEIAGEEGFFEAITGGDVINTLKLGAVAFVPIVAGNILLTKITLPEPVERIKPFLPPTLAFLLAGLIETKIGREFANAIKIGSGLMFISVLYDRLFAPKLADLLGLYQTSPPEEEMDELPEEEEFSAITPPPSEEQFVDLEAIEPAPSEEEFI